MAARAQRGQGTRRRDRTRRPSGRRLASRWQRVLGNRALWLVVLLGVGCLLLLPEVRLFAARVQAGQIANRDYLATRDVLVLDAEATAAQRERARAGVLPVYDIDPLLARQQDELMTQLFERGRALFEAAKAAGARLDAPALQSVLSELQASTGLRVTTDQLALLWKREFAAEVEDRVRGLVTRCLRAGVVEHKSQLLENRLSGVTLRNLETGAEHLQLDLYEYLGLPDEVQIYLESETGRWSTWSRSERSAIADLVLANLPPNIYLNRSETAARRAAADSSAEQVFRQIRQGQVIVRKGDEIAAAAVRLLEELGTNRRRVQQLLPLLGNLILLALVGALISLGQATERARRSLDRSAFGGVVLVLLVTLLAVKLGLLVSGALGGSFESPPFNSERSYTYAIPYAAFALLVSLLYGRGLAMVAAVGFSVLVGRLFGEAALWPTVFALSGSLAAVYSLDRVKERAAVTRAGLVVGGVNVASALMLAAFAGDSAAPLLGLDVMCALSGGVLVAAAASFALPILESLLGATTDIKLIELSDTNHSLLRRLAFEAPGTFQHSLMVSNLAKIGCEAIDANSILAYTAGLYHDVGKVIRPLYFVENQRPGVNRHDRLSPSMSALVVISHVKDGVELAREHGLPAPLIDAIEQHHGSRKLTFFLNRALERKSDDRGVAESDYRYPGPRPQNKVMGVLMYADAVEAAARVLRDPTPARIRNLLREILDDCLEDRQFDESGLTLGDLRKVSDAFFRVLESIYHQRVDYPGFDFNKPGLNKESQRESGPFRVIEGAKP